MSKNIQKELFADYRCKHPSPLVIPAGTPIYKEDIAGIDFEVIFSTDLVHKCGGSIMAFVQCGVPIILIHELAKDNLPDHVYKYNYFHEFGHALFQDLKKKGFKHIEDEELFADGVAIDKMSKKDVVEAMEHMSDRMPSDYGDDIRRRIKMLKIQ